MQKRTVDILGYAVNAGGLQEDLELAWAAIKSGTKGNYVACANPHSLVVARNDDTFSVALRDADVLLPDGVGIVLAARLLGLELNERVAGSEFFQGLSYKAEHSGGLRYFFLGSSRPVLDLIVKRIRKEFPAIQVCGTYSPPYKSDFSREDNKEMCARINAARPDVLWVGMTAPKQEKWIHQNRDQLEVALIGAVGAVFDFYAGTKKRAPAWACRTGFEWLPRLMREPKRLFRRNFASTPLFLFMVWQAWVGRGRFVGKKNW